MDEFDIKAVPFVSESVAARKWAFAADYIRMYALYTEGGVYLDSDVFVRKPMDFVLENRAFSAVEYFPHLAEPLYADGEVDMEGNKRDPEAKIHGIQIQAAILGAEKGHPFFKECLDYYNGRHFSTDADGIPAENQISPIVLAGIAEKYGFRYVDCEQSLKEGFKLYPSQLFASQGYLMTPQAVAVHCCNGSWRLLETPVGHFFSNIKIYMKNFLSRIGLLRKDFIGR